MSKYIDAEFEIAHYTSMTTQPTPDVSEKDKRDSLIILEALRRAKSIDIVHCGECRHWAQAPKTDKGWCDRLDGLLEPTWYCADGERKSDEI